MTVSISKLWQMNTNQTASTFLFRSTINKIYMSHVSSAVSREKAVLTPIDRLRNATIIAESLASARVTAETATKIAELKGAPLGGNIFKITEVSAS